MKKLSNTITDNCIPTPSSCTQWNGGDIAFLGICNGDWLNNVIWEIVTKLEELAGEDLSQFDYDSLLTICNQKAPLEINLINILGLLRDNQVCLKDYIDTLQEQIAEISKTSSVDINLKCYSDFDNLGNSLLVTRSSLDQLVIDKLCEHKSRIDTVEGKIILLTETVGAIDLNPQVDELAVSLPACVTGGGTAAPTSTQVVRLANDYCDLKSATGTEEKIAQALANTPETFSSVTYTTLPNWVIAPATLAENYNNLLIAFGQLEARIAFMEDNCCAATCDDVKVGFSAVMNEEQAGIVLRFISGAGTAIPSGFTDAGSLATITDIDGNVIDFPIEIENNAEVDIDLTGLNMLGDLDVNLTVKMTNGVVVCEKCVYRKVTLPGCTFCTITANAPITIIYETTIL